MLLKKDFNNLVRQLVPTDDRCPVKIWFQDEARFGLISDLRRIWAKRGGRPPRECCIRRDYLYLFSSVCPESGEIESFISPFANSEAMNYHLTELARNHPDTRNVVILDGAGWHISKTLEIPENVTLIHLPPYSPELNPTERLWLYIRDHFTGNQNFHDLDQLERVLVRVHQTLATRADIIKSVTKTTYAEINQSN